MYRWGEREKVWVDSVGSGVRANRLCLPNSRRVVQRRLGHLSELCSFGVAQPARLGGHRRVLERVFTRVNSSYCVRPPFRSGFNKRRMRFNGRVCTGFNLALISSARVCINSGAVFNPRIAITATNRPVSPALETGRCRCGVPVRVNGGY